MGKALGRTDFPITTCKFEYDLLTFHSIVIICIMFAPVMPGRNLVARLLKCEESNRTDQFKVINQRCNLRGGGQGDVYLLNAQSDSFSLACLCILDKDK
jgi:hypothetical protein